MQPVTPQPKRIPFFRRWRVPIAASFAVNLLALIYATDWFGPENINVPEVISLKHIYLVQPPQTALKPQRTPDVTPHQPKPQTRDYRPRQPKSLTHRNAATARSGARPAPVYSAEMPHVTPRSVAPQNQERNVDRDPFQPDIAPAVMIPQPTRAQHTVALPAPPAAARPTRPAEIAAATGSGTTALMPRSTPTPTVALHPASGAAGEPGTVRVGSGGQGQGERGAGAGAGGVLPFGLGGGRGGDGNHHILYVVDYSPSMDSRLPDLRKELARAMANLTPDDLFDIYAFGGEVVKMEDYLEPATPDSLSDARRFLSRTGTIQSTNVEQVMLEALSLHHTNEILLITDGVPDEGEQNFVNLENEIRLANVRHIPISVIGLVGINVFNNAEETFQAAQLLHAIARQSGGNYELVPLGTD